MNLSAVEEAAAEKIDLSQRPPYRIYAAILVGFVLLRIFAIATDHMEWTVGIYASTNWQVGLALAAGVAAWFTARYLGRRLPLSITWLLCGIVGGAVTLLTSSIIGMVIGFCVGGISLLLDRRQTHAVCRRGGRLLRGYLFPPVACSVITGAAAALSYHRFGAPNRNAEIMALLVPVLLGLIGWLIYQSRQAVRWWSWPLTGGLFLLLLPVMIIESSGLETYWLTRRSVGPAERLGVDFGSLADMAAPSGGNPAWSPAKKMLYEAATSFPQLHAVNLELSPASTPADIRRASKLPALKGLHIRQGSSVTDAQFRQLHLRYLRWLGIERGSRLTDAALQAVDLSQLESLQLQGPTFGDAALQGLDHAHKLYSLDLADTQVTADALQQLSTKHAGLWQLALAGTQVGDEIFEVVDRLPAVQRLDLSRTQVTGAGLERIRDRLVALTLDDTPLDQQNLYALAPRPSPSHAQTDAAVYSLSLRGISLTADSLHILKLMQLHSLYLYETQLSYEQVVEFTKHKTLMNLGVDLSMVTTPLIANAHADQYLHFYASGKRHSTDEIVAWIQAAKAPASDSLSSSDIRIQVQLNDVTLNAQQAETLVTLSFALDKFDFRFRRLTLPSGEQLDYSSPYDLNSRLKQAAP